MLAAEGALGLHGWVLHELNCLLQMWGDQLAVALIAMLLKFQLDVFLERNTLEFFCVQLKSAFFEFVVVENLLVKFRVRVQNLLFLFLYLKMLVVQ